MSKKKRITPVAPVCNKPSTREEILAELALPGQTMKRIPGTNLTLRLKVPTFERISEVKIEKKRLVDINAALAVECCADLLPEDVAAILQGNPTVAAAIVDAALTLPTTINKAAVGKQ